jgi:multicomponent Na+:H+ antiporter subunit A
MEYLHDIFFVITSSLCFTPHVALRGIKMKEYNEPMKLVHQHEDTSRSISQRILPNLGGIPGWLVSLLPLALFLGFASVVGTVASGEVLRVSYPWVPALGISLSFALDGLALLFALLVSGTGTLVVLYASSYLAGHAQLGRFYSYILLFLVAMLGLVLADNLVTLFVFWELTSITSYLLIGFNHRRAEARASALQALLITGGGGLALMAGLVLLGMVGGSFELSVLMQQGDIIRSSNLYVPILLLILAGAFTKSAQVPFHFWLPGAMEAPTPVSSYLHSATMVKAGIYLLARLTPVLGGTVLWHDALVIVGSATMLIGAYLAPRQGDLKRLLAYSTVSSLGTLVLLLGIGTPIAIKAAVVFLLVHALYKGALFMVAGIVDHEAGTREIEHVRGLRHAMPITAIVAVLAAFSFAGMPPMFGFIGKELVYEAKLTAPNASIILTTIAVASNALLVAAGLMTIQPFLGKEPSAPKHPHEAPIPMLIGPAMLAGLGLLIGLLPHMVAEPLIAPMVGAIQGEAAKVKLALWHGINAMLILSVITVISGVALFLGRGVFCCAGQVFDRLASVGPQRWYQLALDGLMATAEGLNRIIQRGTLRSYLLVIILTTVAMAGVTLLRTVDIGNVLVWPRASIFEWVLALVILASAVLTVRARSRLTAMVALGGVGFGVTLLFILFSAPDLAATQFAIETLTVLLFVLVLYRLPKYAMLSSTPDRVRDAVVALGFGGLMTLITLAITSYPLSTHVSDYVASASVPLANGRNIVNVILVDVRGIDTLGEITVLAVAAIGVYALLTLRPPEESGATTLNPDQRPVVRNRRIPKDSIILSTAARFLAPLMVLFSLYLLLRGHNEPGGGFVGGLLVAVAFALYVIAYDVQHARRMLRLDPRTLMGIGLLVALISGVPALLRGEPFMTGVWLEQKVPVIGKVGTPLLFDVGVYILVFGMALTIIFGLAERAEDTAEGSKR